MFTIQNHLNELMKHNAINSVLDLGTGDGRYSVFCASYGSQITAVDNRQMKSYKYPDYLVNHPKIQFIEADVLYFIEQLEAEQQYDLVLLLNVIVFLHKDSFLGILPKLLSHLRPGGNMLLTFFFADDETMSINRELSFYHFEDFEIPEGFEIRNTQDIVVEEIHKPYGIHTHHIGYMEIGRV